MQPVGTGGTAPVTDLDAAGGIGPVMSPLPPQVLAVDAGNRRWPGDASALLGPLTDRLQCGPEKDNVLVVASILMTRVSRAPSSAVRAAAIRPLHQHEGSAR